MQFGDRWASERVILETLRPSERITINTTMFSEMVLAIRIATITLASDSAITLARFRPSKMSLQLLFQGFTGVAF